MMAGVQDYWMDLCRRNKGLTDSDATMRMTVGAFRKAIEAAYDAGSRDTAEVARKLEGRGVPDFLEQLFKRTKK